MTSDRLLGYAFRRPELLAQALTHRSYGAPHNERLEFVGDAVLNCAIAAVLYRRFPQIPEGDLSRVRASLVNRDTLAELARTLGVGDALRLGEGEQKSGGAARPSILADALEAVFGAIFLDAGFDAAAAVIETTFATLLADLDPAALVEGSEDAAAGMAAGATNRRAGVRRDRRRRRCPRADVHRRVPDSRAGRRCRGRRRESARGRAGGGVRRVRAGDGGSRNRATWVSPIPRRVSAADTSRSSDGRTSASRRCVNRLVGEKISITSRKAQTTRHRVTGILTTGDAQFVFVDTPGFQTRHRSRLNERMNRAVTQSLAAVDAVVLVLEAGRTVAADRAVIDLLPEAAGVVAALNKVDTLAAKDALAAADGGARRAATVRGDRARERRERPRARPPGLAEVRALLPESPPLYGADEITDRDERFLAAEFVREKIFRLLGDEVPYQTTVAIDEFRHEGDIRHIRATVFVDRDNQRAILVGAGGAKMKEIGTSARVDMERLFGGKVFLEVWVRVRKGWADDEAALTASRY